MSKQDSIKFARDLPHPSWVHMRVHLRRANASRLARRGVSFQDPGALNSGTHTCPATNDGCTMCQHIILCVWVWDLGVPGRLREAALRALSRQLNQVWEVLKGPPLRVNFENVVRQLFSNYDRKKTRQGCAARLWNQSKHPFQIDPLQWNLTFLSARPQTSADIYIYIYIYSYIYVYVYVYV